MPRRRILLRRITPIPPLSPPFPRHFNLLSFPFSPFPPPTLHFIPPPFPFLPLPFFLSSSPLQSFSSHPLLIMQFTALHCTQLLFPKEKEASHSFYIYIIINHLLFVLFCVDLCCLAMLYRPPHPIPMQRTATIKRLQLVITASQRQLTSTRFTHTLPHFTYTSCFTKRFIHLHTHTPFLSPSATLLPLRTHTHPGPVSQSVSHVSHVTHSVSFFSDATVSPVKQLWSATRLDLTALYLTN